MTKCEVSFQTRRCLVRTTTVGLAFTNVIVGGPEENKSVAQTVIDTAPDPTKSLAFNYASEALNNSFFLDFLVRPSPSFPIIILTSIIHCRNPYQKGTITTKTASPPTSGPPSGTTRVPSTTSSPASPLQQWACPAPATSGLSATRAATPPSSPPTAPGLSSCARASR